MFYLLRTGLKEANNRQPFDKELIARKGVKLCGKFVNVICLFQMKLLIR